MATSEEISLDCEELRRLVALTTRESVIAILTAKIAELEGKLTAHEEPQPSEKGDGSTPSSTPTPEPSEKSDGSPTLSDPTPKPTESQKIMVSQLAAKTITSYGWDQSPKFVKVYITLNGVHELAKEDVTVVYTTSSFTLKVKKKDCIHQLAINSLLEELIPEKSYHKVKTDNLVILLKKTSEKNWDYLTQTEQKTKQKKAPPKAAEAADPSAGIMSMMKQMYDDGDDEMKRTIAKAWTQARDKKDTVDFP